MSLALSHLRQPCHGDDIQLTAAVWPLFYDPSHGAIGAWISGRFAVALLWPVAELDRLRLKRYLVEDLIDWGSPSRSKLRIAATHWMDFIEEVAGWTSHTRIADDEGDGARIDELLFTARVRGPASPSAAQRTPPSPAAATAHARVRLAQGWA